MTQAHFAKLPRSVGDGVIGEGDDFFDCLCFAEMAGSVLHEICRYRSGEERSVIHKEKINAFASSKLLDLL